MPLRREAPDPLYVQLKESLAADIRAGHYRAHMRLPSERELAIHYNVSRMTVRQALLDLAHAGSVYTRVGKGTYVAERKVEQQLAALTGFTQDIRALGGKPASVVLEAGYRPAPAQIAAALRLSPGEQVFVLARVRLADDRPMSIETAYLSGALCPGLIRHDFAVESLYGVLERDYGLHLSQAEQVIEAALADAEELRLLELSAPAAVLHMQRLTYTGPSLQPVEYVFSTYRGDRYKFRSLLRSEADLAAPAAPTAMLIRGVS